MQLQKLFPALDPRRPILRAIGPPHLGHAGESGKGVSSVMRPQSLRPGRPDYAPRGVVSSETELSAAKIDDSRRSLRSLVWCQRDVMGSSHMGEGVPSSMQSHNGGYPCTIAH